MSPAQPNYWVFLFRKSGWIKLKVMLKARRKAKLNGQFKTILKTMLMTMRKAKLKPKLRAMLKPIRLLQSQVFRNLRCLALTNVGVGTRAARALWGCLGFRITLSKRTHQRVGPQWCDNGFSGVGRGHLRTPPRST